ncbi:MAG: type II secretion system protein [Acidobacteria bacterium]|nr:type II secretion system protein [Acidobacteriota bacterium]MBI3657997.1 type II secretion system protein [Acidobacteriota bacterium]
MKRQNGFSMIELMMVVGIIALLAMLLFPMLAAARRSANESSAIGTLKALASAEFTYASRNSQKYGTMAQLFAGSYVDNRFSAPGIVSGFTYSENQPIPSGPTPYTAPDGFGIKAIHVAGSADFDFEIGWDGVIRYGPSNPGGSEGAPVGK